MGLVKITINNKDINVPDNISVLEACKMANIEIPTLCYHKDQNIKASCRLCIVEIEGYPKPQTSCSTKVEKGMIIKTHSPKIIEERQILLDLILADHDFNCNHCERNMNCELQHVASMITDDDNRFDNNIKIKPIDNTSLSLTRNPNKCIKCGRCIEMCSHIQGLNILEKVGRSKDVQVSPSYGKFLADTNCSSCGQCSTICPVAAITEKNDIDSVIDAINNPEKIVIVQIAPAIRVSMSECFNNDIEITTNKIIGCLRHLGFDKVFDTNLGADLTIIEEASELYDRVKNNKTLPMITSCCPGWINYVEKVHPEVIPHLSTCKSPMSMMGSIIKNYYSIQNNIDKKNIVNVAIMPCTAKKHERGREEFNNDIDIVLTTRELVKMIKKAGLDFNAISESEFDDPISESSGAGAIFGNTGGVMEAALRTFYKLYTKQELDKVDFYNVRGMKGIKEATININNTDIKVLVVHSLSNAKIAIDKLKEYTFIEVMACPGGCIGGGGQPYKSSNDTKKEKMDLLYDIDKQKSKRKSHENYQVKKLYDDFLGQPLSSKAHELLHTHYINRKK